MAWHMAVQLSLPPVASDHENYSLNKLILGKLDAVVSNSGEKSTRRRIHHTTGYKYKCKIRIRVNCK